MKRENEKFQTQQSLTVKKFHQFVKIDRGPVNAAIIDLLSGNVFQVPNSVIDKLEAGLYNEIQEFLEIAKEENLVIDIEPYRWIPAIDIAPDPKKEAEKEMHIELHLEDGVNLDQILSAFCEYPVFKIFYYSDKIPAGINTNIEIELKEKNFSKCVEQASVDGNFCKTPESIVSFNMRYNSCWGTVIAITADGMIRPCIHSLIKIGNIEDDLEDIDGLLEKMQPYWNFNKDKVERCRDCEFRHVCFDCREIAMQKNGEINGPNPMCSYNPYSGEWENQTN